MEISKKIPQISNILNFAKSDILQIFLDLDFLMFGILQPQLIVDDVIHLPPGLWLQADWAMAWVCPTFSSLGKTCLLDRFPFKLLRDFFINKQQISDKMSG